MADNDQAAAPATIDVPTAPAAEETPAAAPAEGAEAVAVADDAAAPAAVEDAGVEGGAVAAAPGGETAGAVESAPPANNSLPFGQKPPNYIKLFVGQVPRQMDESALKVYFEPYGAIHEVFILRHNYTGESKGAGFVTYNERPDGDKAIAALHGKITLPGAMRTIQVSYATGEAERLGLVGNTNIPGQEIKVFVGMLPRFVFEEQLDTLFSRYGSVTETTVLRNHDGSSKCCGFVKFSDRPSAETAIMELNGTHAFEGAQSPITVKYADTPQEKRAKRMAKMMMNDGFGGPMGGFQQGGYGGYGQQQGGYGGYGQQQQGGYGGYGQQQQGGYGGYGAGAAGAAAGGYPGAAAPAPAIYQQQPPSYASYYQQPAAAAPAAYGAAPAAGGAAGGYYGAPAAAAPAAGVAAYYPQQGAAAGGYGAGAGAGGAGGGGGGNAQGPANANLFIYHMPPDFTDQDLQATFAPYGALLSVKVFRDKNTGESKCFGFASYADPTSAQAAIQALNGFQVRGKRLRVELKRPRGATAGAPY